MYVICIVDDDTFARQATANLVESLGYRVTFFASAEDFLDSERADRPSCLIADVQMPGLDGLELQKHLIDQGIGTPIIFVTAFYSERMRAQAMGAGAIGVLQKPYAEATLIECLRRALGECGNYAI